MDPNHGVVAISAMAESGSASGNEVSIPAGKVGQVCREWLVREDGGFAYRLQNEEINRFYEGNRSKNQVVRSDLRSARTLQEEEILQAIVESEQLRHKQEERDRLLAERLQQELQETTNDRVNGNTRVKSTAIYENLPVDNRQYSPQMSSMEGMAASNGNIASSSTSSSPDSRLPRDELVEKDRQLAERIHLKEKMRALRRQLAKEKRQVARLTSNHVSIPSAHHNRNGSYDGTSSDDLLDTDLSDFLMKPPPGLSEGDAKIFQEEQDAELARFLQRQETLKNLVKEKLQEIESHDAEIARMLHEQERQKLKRMKDRRRQKKEEERTATNERDHLHRQQLPSLQAPVKTRASNVNNNNHYQSQEEIEQEMRRKQRERELSGMGSYDVLESMSYLPKHRHLKQETPPLKTRVDHHHEVLQQSSSSQGASSTFHNIAKDLDPTYKKSNVQTCNARDHQTTSYSFHEEQILHQQNQVARVTSSEMADSNESLDPLDFARECQITDLDLVASHQINKYVDEALGQSPVTTLQYPVQPQTQPKQPTQLSDLESLPKHVQPGHHRRSGDKNKKKKEDGGCKTQ